jgi:hypothetical protein
MIVFCNSEKRIELGTKDSNSEVFFIIIEYDIAHCV